MTRRRGAEQLDHRPSGTALERYGRTPATWSESAPRDLAWAALLLACWEGPGHPSSHPEARGVLCLSQGPAQQGSRAVRGVPPLPPVPLPAKEKGSQAGFPADKQSWRLLCSPDRYWISAQPACCKQTDEQPWAAAFVKSQLHRCVPPVVYRDDRHSCPPRCAFAGLTLSPAPSYSR